MREHTKDLDESVRYYRCELRESEEALAYYVELRDALETALFSLNRALA